MWVWLMGRTFTGSCVGSSGQCAVNLHWRRRRGRVGLVSWRHRCWCCSQLHLRLLRQCRLTAHWPLLPTQLPVKVRPINHTHIVCMSYVRLPRHDNMVLSVWIGQLHTYICTYLQTLDKAHDSRVQGLNLRCRPLFAINCSESTFSVSDSLESWRIQFTPARQTRHGQDCFVGSGLVWQGELGWVSISQRW